MVLIASRLDIVLSGLVLACSCDAKGLRLLSAHDAGDTGGSDGANPAEAPAATGGSDAAGATGGVGGSDVAAAMGGVGGDAAAAMGGVGGGGAGAATGGAGGSDAPFASGGTDAGETADKVGNTDSTTVGRGAFLPTGRLALARQNYTATLLLDGKVLVAGGIDDGGNYLAAAELYDPGAGTFTATGSMTTARTAHTATLLPDGKVLIAGGLHFDVIGGYPNLASAELYDPSAGTFTATGSMTVVRAFHAATMLGSGKVLIAGGGFWFSAASAELYDPVAGTFTATGSMIAGGTSLTAMLLSSGKVLILGGGLGNTELPQLYDPATGTFTAAGSMPPAGQGRTVTLLNDGTVLVAGGGDTSAQLYDPATGTFTATGSMIAARAFHAATLLPSGIVLVAGGDDPAGGMALASAELYDPASGTFAATGRMITARSAPTATLLLSGEVLIAGGDALDSRSYTNSPDSARQPKPSYSFSISTAMVGWTSSPATALPADRVLARHKQGRGSLRRQELSGQDRLDERLPRVAAGAVAPDGHIGAGICVEADWKAGVAVGAELRRRDDRHGVKAEVPDHAVYDTGQAEAQNLTVRCPAAHPEVLDVQALPRRHRVFRLVSRRLAVGHLAAGHDLNGLDGRQRPARQRSRERSPRHAALASYLDLSLFRRHGRSLQGHCTASQVLSESAVSTGRIPGHAEQFTGNTACRFLAPAGRAGRHKGAQRPEVFSCGRSDQSSMSISRTLPKSRSWLIRAWQPS